MNTRKLILLLGILYFLPYILKGQKYYRITGDYSNKTVTYDGKAMLSRGTFYYDKNYQKLVYVNSFPEKDIWVPYDTMTFNIIKEKVVKRIKTPPLAQFSIFQLALTSQINNYGLKKSGFLIDKVEKAGDMVITTWIPPKYLAKMFGKVLISIKSNKLSGIVFIESTGKILRKQFFNNFENFNGVEFPLEVIDITYTNGKENYQVSTYKKIQVDEVSSNYFYNYPVPFF